MTFKELELSEPILRALTEEKYETPTPIQAQAIPPVLAGHDLIGCAQTGTGKTAAFALPILEKLIGESSHVTRVLVLTPTRELAMQIFESFRSYSRHMPVRSAVIFGGTSQVPQVEQLRRGVDVLVATPGRLIDLINQRVVSLGKVDTLVLDEADRMLDMGFLPDVKRITTKLQKEKQTLLFSATMPKEIEELANTLLVDPVKIAVTPVSSPVDLINQRLFYTDKENKPQLLKHLVQTLPMQQVLVFTRTKHGADKVTRFLNHEGLSAAAIHGDKSQNRRQQALREFKEWKTRILVATDIAARGIDIEELPFVVNYDIPNESETYVHRIGRTGRAGNGGTALSFCDFSERPYIRDIEKLIEREIPVDPENPFPMENFIVPPKTTQRRQSKKQIAAPYTRDGAKAGAGATGKGGNRPYRGGKPGGAGKPSPGKPGGGYKGGANRGNASKSGNRSK